MNDNEWCVEAVEVLYHYLDGDLDADRRRVISQHLDDCPPCLDAFDFEKDLRVALAQKCRDHVPDELKKRVFAALNELHEAENRRTI